MGPGGASTLWDTGAPHPPRRRAGGKAAPLYLWAPRRRPSPCRVVRAPCPPLADSPPAGAGRPTPPSPAAPGLLASSVVLRPRPLGRLGSSRLPAVHLPPINPVISRGPYLNISGDTRLGEGFPLRCFQRFARPHVATQRCRFSDNWHTSGASNPVLSY